MKLILFLAIIVLISSCSSKPNAVIPKNAYIGNGDYAVYVVSHGWHTGLVIPAKTIQKRMPELKERFSRVAYIEFGWGDEKVYQADKITFGLILQAIFWPTPSIVHAVAISNTVEDYFKNSRVERLCLTDKELSLINSFIVESFDRNAKGETISLKKGIYGDSQFYQSVGEYYSMNTCNAWTAKGLKSIGMDISPMFKQTADSVMRFLQKNKNQFADC